MKNYITFFSALVVALIMTACAMSNEVHFNKNYSGTYALYVDLGDMIEMVKSFDPSAEKQMEGDFIDEAMSEADRQEMKAKINDIKGLSNASFEVIEQSRIELKFDFDDIPALNKAFSEIQSAFADENEMLAEGMTGMESMGLPRFTKDGKIITHGASFQKDQLPDGALEGLDELGGDGMMDMVMGMMDYTVELSFDRKIKSVKIDGVDLVSQDKHIVKARIDMGKMINGGEYKIDVTTK